MKRTLRVARTATIISVTTLLVSGCGGGGREPNTQNDAEQENAGSDREGSGMQASAEIGALDEAAVDSTFRKSLSGLQRCLDTGARRIEFLGGKVSFYIEVSSSGATQSARLEDSTIGDRETEKCMLGVLARKSWPKPVGGEKGYARKSFDFDPPNDVRPPTEWDGERVNETLEKLSSELGECKHGSHNRYKATMYVSTDGKPLGVGVASESGASDEELDCVVDQLKGATYPSPGSWPAKVSFEL